MVAAAIEYRQVEKNTPPVRLSYAKKMLQLLTTI